MSWHKAVTVVFSLRVKSPKFIACMQDMAVWESILLSLPYMLILNLQLPFLRARLQILIQAWPDRTIWSAFTHSHAWRMATDRLICTFGTIVTLTWEAVTVRAQGFIWQLQICQLKSARWLVLCGSVATQRLDSPLARLSKRTWGYCRFVDPSGFNRILLILYFQILWVAVCRKTLHTVKT